MDNKEKAGRIFLKAVESVNPAFLVKSYSEQIISYCRARSCEKIAVIGFGKAAFQMAKAVEAAFEPDFIAGGIVVTKYGHAKDQRSAVSGQQSDELKKIVVYEAGHPIPDVNGVKATEEIVRFLKGIDEKTMVVCLISGGGSALFVSPSEGISLAEKQSITELLLKAGANINELNAVRKHLSGVKGGRLAEMAYPSEMVSLIISDVIGDRLDVIASGPTAPDTSTYEAAIDVIDKYGLREAAPDSIINLLEKGKRGLIPETPKKDNSVFSKVSNLIVGNNLKALEAARNEALSLGFEAEIISSDITGEAKVVGKQLAKKAKEIRLSRASRPYCLISGGETTVTVSGKGKGGRNTELALSFALEIEAIDDITFLSAGTDGNDGPTDAAGAVVDGMTIRRAKALGLDPQVYLRDNNSYNFFKKTGSLLITGPTGTNVMDLQIVLIAH